MMNNDVEYKNNDEMEQILRTSPIVVADKLVKIDTKTDVNSYSNGEKMISGNGIKDKERGKIRC